MHLVTISVLPLLLTACIHWPEIATECEEYGVIEGNSPMGSVVHVEPLDHDELNTRCAGVDHSNAAGGTEIRGCVIPQSNGMVNAFYSVGDRCAMNHELCHAKHGSGHTERYVKELRDGVPMPYCPSNQLSWKR